MSKVGWNSKKRSTVTCLIRPDGDDIADIYGGTYYPAFLPMDVLQQVKAGDKFDVLCQDGLNYMCSIKKYQHRLLKHQ